VVAVEVEHEMALHRKGVGTDEEGCRVRVEAPVVRLLK
jgi:hypothetical protein